MMLRSFYRNEKAPLGFAAFMQGPPLVDMFGVGHGNVQKWMRRVKLAFDPKNLSDSVHYITPEKPALAKVWPVAKRIGFQPWFASIFRRLLSKME